MPRVLETAYCEDIVKPVHKPTNPRKHRTRNTNWRARLKLKQNDDCLSEELQSSVRPGPRCGPVGGRRLKSGLFNRYVIVGISEVFGHNHADLQSVTLALAHCRFVNYSTAPRPKRRRFKFEKNSRKGCDTFEKKRFRHLDLLGKHSILY